MADFKYWHTQAPKLKYPDRTRETKTLWKNNRSPNENDIAYIKATDEMKNRISSLASITT